MADSLFADRNTSKIKDWIDAVYVKKRFYSAEAGSSAMHLPPAPQPQVGLPCLKVLLVYTEFLQPSMCAGATATAKHQQQCLLCWR